MIHSRRGFLTGLVGLVAAPAVCKAEWLMPVKAIHVPRFHTPRSASVEVTEAQRMYNIWYRQIVDRLESLESLNRSLEMRELPNYGKSDTITFRRPIAFTAS